MARPGVDSLPSLLRLLLFGLGGLLVAILTTPLKDVERSRTRSSH